MSAPPQPMPREPLAPVAVAPARVGERAALGRLLRRIEREAWDRERERRRRHAAILSRWPPLWG